MRGRNSAGNPLSDSPDGGGRPSFLRPLDDGPLDHHRPTSHIESHGELANEPFEYAIWTNPENRVLRAAHSRIGQDRRAASKNRLVRRLHVGMRAEYGHDAAVKEPPHRYLLGRRLRVHVDENNLTSLLNRRKVVLDCSKRTI